jgi:deoxyribodipyrimidine photo-lyase
MVVTNQSCWLCGGTWLTYLMSSDLTDHSDKPVIVLFRRDLRLGDNGALTAAAASGKPVIAAFVFDEQGDLRNHGAASKWWLHHSLNALAESLAGIGLKLVLRQEPMQEAVDRLISETDADAVFWNRRYFPGGMKVDAALKENLRQRGLLAESFDGHLLHHPPALRTSSGGPFRVYSPFWRALEQNIAPDHPIPAPVDVKTYSGSISTEKLDDWGFLPKNPDWSVGMQARWKPGEAGAHERLEQFIDGALRGYSADRDIPGKITTSRLSPHLAHGEVTPRQIWRALSDKAGENARDDILKFRKEVAWREFAYHLLFRNPDLDTVNYNGNFDQFAWREPGAAFDRWKHGQTGYPIVDAGMRELWQTGWMHNRVRMVAASFLVKHLLIDWRYGEAWFWDTLVDADPANNPASWQWVAGSGADAAPYFRVFNPVLQGKKFDPDGLYVRRYVPELAMMPNEFIHSPWEAPRQVLEDAGVVLGSNYPKPIVDHPVARERALSAFKQIREEA